MAMTKEKVEATGLVYDLQGTLLEACSCGVLCPCWVGEDPDGGTCDAFIAYHFDAGTIRGVDVSGLSMVTVNHIPGNVLTPASWKVVLFVDSRATDAQHQAIVDAYSGKLGGPLADLAGLIGEVLDVRRETISHEIRGGTGALQIGDFVSAEMAPFAGPDGTPTTLRDTILIRLLLGYPNSVSYLRLTQLKNRCLLSEKSIAFRICLLPWNISLHCNLFAFSAHTVRPPVQTR